MKTAAAYIRVSTDDQMEYSPDSQLKSIREYAKRNDFILPDEYIFIEEEGRSGRKASKRPQFMRMIGTAKTKPKPFDVILLWKFSRFARNREDSILYKSMLRKQCGVDVVSISENIGDDKMSVLIEALIEAMDEYYSINLAEEVKRGMTEKATRGEPLGQAPFGYTSSEGRFIPNPQTAPIVKMIYTQFLSGKGYREIASQLNVMGIHTLRGNPFDNRGVEYILRNPVYIGKIRWNPAGKSPRDFSDPNLLIVDSTHTPLISQKDWDLAQAHVAELKKMYAPKAKTKVNQEFALRGLVRCSNCGATLVMAVRGVSVQCYEYAKGRCNVSHSMTIKKLTEWVFHTIKEDINNDNYRINIKQRDSQTENRKIISNQLEREQIKLERIREAYEAGIDTLEEYKTNKTKIQLQIQTLKDSLTEIPLESPEEFQKKFRGRVQKLLPKLFSPESDEHEKNQILRSFVDYIEFNRTKNTLTIFYYV